MAKLTIYKIYCNAYYCQQTHTKQNHHFKAKIKFDIKLDQAALIRFVTWNELIAFIINLQKDVLYTETCYSSSHVLECQWVVLFLSDHEHWSYVYQ